MNPTFAGPIECNRKKNLGRVDMSVATSTQTVEQLTISIDKTGDATAVLSIAWENTVASVPISVTPREPGNALPISPPR